MKKKGKRRKNQFNQAHQDHSRHPHRLQAHHLLFLLNRNITPRSINREINEIIDQNLDHDQEKK